MTARSKLEDDGDEIDDEDYNNVFDDEYNRLLVCQKGETDRNPFYDDIR